MSKGQKKKQRIISPEKALPHVHNMLRNLAWKFVRRYRLEFDEVMSEAYQGFMKACRTFQPDRGMKFSSWCYMTTWRWLQGFIQKRTLDLHVFFEEIKEEMLPERDWSWGQFLSGFSGDAREILHLLLETPVELIRVPSDNEQLLLKLKCYLRRNKGFSARRFERARYEIVSQMRRTAA